MNTTPLLCEALSTLVVLIAFSLWLRIAEGGGKMKVTWKPSFSPARAHWGWNELPVVSGDACQVLCKHRLPLSTDAKGKPKDGRKDRTGQGLTTSSFHLLWQVLKRGYICSVTAQGVQCILLTAALLALSQANSLFLMYTYKIMNNAEKADGGLHGGVLHRRDIKKTLQNVRPETFN